MLDDRVLKPLAVLSTASVEDEEDD